MPKNGHKIVKFQGLIRQMWRRRTSLLLAVVGNKRMGRKAQFSKKYRTSRIRDLQEIAAELEKPKLRSMIARNTFKRTVRFSKGLRNDQKWRVLHGRASRWPHGRHLVYITWDSGGTLFKGRSLRRWAEAAPRATICVLLSPSAPRQRVLSEGSEEEFPARAGMRTDASIPTQLRQDKTRATQVPGEVFDLPSTETD